MSASIIGLLIIVCIIVLVGVYYLLNSSERMNEKKAAQVSEIIDFATKLQKYAQYIPTRYLDREIQQACLNESQACLNYAKTLAPNNPALDMHLKKNNAIAQGTATSKGAGGVAENLEQADDIRTMLNGIFKFSKDFRSINIASKRNIQESIRHAFIQCTIDAFSGLAQGALKKNKPKLAVFYFSKIIGEFVKNNTDGKYDAAIQNYKEQVNKIKQGKSEAPEAKQGSAKKSISSAKQKEWDEFLDDDKKDKGRF